LEIKVCGECGAGGEKISLNRCPICFKLSCESCQFNRGGRLFCSVYCADSFFFDEED